MAEKHLKSAVADGAHHVYTHTPACERSETCVSSAIEEYENLQLRHIGSHMVNTAAPKWRNGYPSEALRQRPLGCHAQHVQIHRSCIHNRS